MKALEVIHLRTAGVVQACQHFYHSESRDEWISLSGITIHVCEAVVMWTIMFGKKG